MFNASELKAAQDLQEMVLDELSSEDAAVRLRVALVVLLQVLLDGLQEPERLRSFLLGLQMLLNLVQ